MYAQSVIQVAAAIDHPLAGPACRHGLWTRLPELAPHAEPADPIDAALAGDELLRPRTSPTSPLSVHKTCPHTPPSIASDAADGAAEMRMVARHRD